jgi:hypothetical protein
MLSTRTIDGTNTKNHMTPSDTTPRKTRAFNTMRAKGWALCLLGLVLLSSPMLLAQSPQLGAYANALRPAGWFAFAAGAVLLGLHHFAQAKRAKAPTKVQANTRPLPIPEAPASGGQPTLREIRDEIKRKADGNT